MMRKADQLVAFIGERRFYTEYVKPAMLYSQLYREGKVTKGYAITYALVYRIGLSHFREKCLYLAKLYKEYINTPQESNITYVVMDRFGNTLTSSEVTLPNGTIVLPPLSDITTEPQYEIVEYNTAQDGSGISYVPGNSFSLSGDTTLYAIVDIYFTINSRVINFGNFQEVVPITYYRRVKVADDPYKNTVDAGIYYTSEEFQLPDDPQATFYPQYPNYKFSLYQGDRIRDPNNQYISDFGPGDTVIVQKQSSDSLTFNLLIGVSSESELTTITFTPSFFDDDNNHIGTGTPTTINVYRYEGYRMPQPEELVSDTSYTWIGGYFGNVTGDTNTTLTPGRWVYSEGNRTLFGYYRAPSVMFTHSFVPIYIDPDTEEVMSQGESYSINGSLTSYPISPLSTDVDSTSEWVSGWHSSPSPDSPVIMLPGEPINNGKGEIIGNLTFYGKYIER